MRVDLATQVLGWTGSLHGLCLTFACIKPNRFWANLCLMHFCTSEILQLRRLRNLFCYLTNSSIVLMSGTLMSGLKKGSRILSLTLVLMIIDCRFVDIGYVNIPIHRIHDVCVVQDIKLWYWIFLFQWLEKDFLEYLSKWDEYAESHSKSATDKSKMMLSRETIEGIRMTGMSVIFDLC